MRIFYHRGGIRRYARGSRQYSGEYLRRRWRQVISAIRQRVRHVRRVRRNAQRYHGYAKYIGHVEDRLGLW